MGISVIPLALHPNLSIQHQQNPSNTLICHSLDTRKLHTLASTVTESQSFTKITKTHQSNSRHCTEDSLVAKNGLLNNVAHLLQSTNLTNPGECTETYALILQKCKKLKNLELGFQVHAQLIVFGVELCEYLGSQILELYTKLGCVNDERKLFEKMHERNVVSWTSMMEMYSGLGDYEETINLFHLMIEESVRPDHFVFLKVFKACSELKNYRVGKDVYDYMLNIGFEGNAWVNRSFLDMFVKCGRMDTARQLFEEVECEQVKR